MRSGAASGHIIKYGCGRKSISFLRKMARREVYLRQERLRHSAVVSSRGGRPAGAYSTVRYPCARMGDLSSGIGTYHAGRTARKRLLSSDGQSRRGPVILRGTRFLRERRADEAETLLRLNGGSSDFTLWKANGRGVDLNVNFQADWGCGAANVRRPGPENYIGPAPFSEPETRALRDLTLALSPDATISFHTKGGEIYWEYGRRTRLCGGTVPRRKSSPLRRDTRPCRSRAARAGIKTGASRRGRFRRSRWRRAAMRCHIP